MSTITLDNPNPTLSDRATNASTAKHPRLWDGLQAYFNARLGATGQVARNASARCCTEGTLFGGAEWDRGAWDFAANGDIIALGNDSRLSGDGDWTWMCNVFVRDGASDNVVLRKGSFQAGDPLVWWYDNDATDHWNFIITDSAGHTTGLTTSASTAVAGEWVRLALVLEADSGVRLYIDGVEDASSPFAAPTVSGIATTENYGFSVIDTQWFDGQCDEIGIWDRALSPSEIMLLQQPNAITEKATQYVTIDAEPSFDQWPYRNLRRLG